MTVERLDLASDIPEQPEADVERPYSLSPIWDLVVQMLGDPLQGSSDE